ncbi:hypothetical protein A2160_04430 [Candidatus Beckwithbacteria bacterium RBG_13_42_9]|uniref:Uncharacterized protein n=1 Tax=Candidatus Beckwithbacteria bacterium RBG_13_42_9 TaxID=1797457 RepID=A0A1F5E6P8_9BACT|nr:MAG: hypothetical protein A2160_04430 [Candidatus Beckwithbacteria bacterium RBG_13_42_9]
MPELPEVETIRRQLQQAVAGKKIAKVEILREKSFQGDSQNLIGKTINAVDRRAKVLVIRLCGSQVSYLLIHLKLTGQLIYQDNKRSRLQGYKVTSLHGERIVGGHPTLDWVGQLPSKHTRVVIHFTDESRLFFNDQRVFGWLKLIEAEKDLVKELGRVGGIEPLTKEFSLENFKKVLSKTGRPIKIVLMDQALIAGVGNIYASDALWLAKISPVKPAKELSESEMEKLKEAIEKVLQLGIKYGGASENTYRQLSGLGGKYQEHFLVYQKEGEECLHCGTTIKKMRLGGRGTCYCPKCQT